MTSKSRFPSRSFSPFVFFCLLVVCFFLRLFFVEHNSLEHALIGKKAPDTVLPLLPGSGLPGFDIHSFSGRVVVVNVFSSWCVSCQEEHSSLMKLSQDPRFMLVGINYKDKIEDASKFLLEFGNPYAAIGLDQKGLGSIEWGIHGVPETFLIDRDGLIIFRHPGPLLPDIIVKKLLPAVEKAL